jgi:hypothetical protein
MQLHAGACLRWQRGRDLESCCFGHGFNWGCRIEKAALEKETLEMRWQRPLPPATTVPAPRSSHSTVSAASNRSARDQSDRAVQHGWTLRGITNALGFNTRRERFSSKDSNRRGAGGQWYKVGGGYAGCMTDGSEWVDLHAGAYVEARGSVEPEFGVCYRWRARAWGMGPL